MLSRRGVTLMEVLVAIFIMGIGMLAMLVLFPLGVLTMAQAIQNDRTAQACRMATALANIQGVRNDPSMMCEVTIPQATAGVGFAQPPLITFTGGGGTGAAGVATISNYGSITGVTITNPGFGYTSVATLNFAAIGGGAGGGAAATVNLDILSNPWDEATWPAGIPMLSADPYGPSFPVFVDPMGFVATAGLSNQRWLSGLGNTIRRRTTSYCLSGGVPTNGLTLRWSCLLDELPFSGDSTPQYDNPPNLTLTPPYPGSFTRNTKYSWAYMLKRPRSSDHGVVEMSVIVYNSRPILSSVFNENLYSNLTMNQGGVQEVTFDPVGNTITIEASDNVVPACRPGDWLLDASYVPHQNGKYATVNGHFYRVVGVTQNTETNYTFEVQQPLRNMAATMANPQTQKVLFLEGVAEVFEKGPGRLP
jgi:prepilin-type N-terminal cleavage/methylation domain-containing protein